MVRPEGTRGSHSRAGPPGRRLASYRRKDNGDWTMRPALECDPHTQARSLILQMGTRDTAVGHGTRATVLGLLFVITLDPVRSWRASVAMASAWRLALLTKIASQLSVARYDSQFRVARDCISLHQGAAVKRRCNPTSIVNHTQKLRGSNWRSRTNLLAERQPEAVLSRWMHRV